MEVKICPVYIGMCNAVFLVLFFWESMLEVIKRNILVLSVGYTLHYDCEIIDGEPAIPANQASY